MNRKIQFQDLGAMEYKACWEYQEELFQQLIGEKKQNTPKKHQHLLFVEHPHVYTLGKSGSDNNLLINSLKLQQIEASYFHINRGGDITYHGPGQIVAYPIIDLEEFGMGMKDYIFSLEEVVIRHLKLYGVQAGRLKGASGVWLDETLPSNNRKICAIGVRTSRYVTMHGFAYNINTMLDYFSYINPCGFTDKAVTSLEKELGVKQDFEKAKAEVKTMFAEVFGMEFTNIAQS